MKTVLVTGGAGFIGSHLCEDLLQTKARVICLDNLSTGSFKNIKKLCLNESFRFIEGDIINPIKIDEKIDEIYNLACPASPDKYQINPLNTIKTSVIGAINILELAAKNNSKILHASTSEVYGDPSITPQKESYWGNVNPIGPRACYDEGKRCAETIFMDSFREFKTKIKIVRIFNTYGPKMSPTDGRVVSNFINQAIASKDITIYGDGSQTRSFQYIDDLVVGLRRMMDSNLEITGPINLGNPEEYKIEDLASIIIRKVKSKSKLTYLPLPQDDPKQRKPDITQAKLKLDGWHPKIKLEEGLERTIQYFTEIHLAG